MKRSEKDTERREKVVVIEVTAALGKAIIVFEIVYW